MPVPAGSVYARMRSTGNQRYLINAYRVLLTRARQGMVIFVPPGNRRIPTRPPEHYESTFRYLAEAGVRVLD